MIADSHAPSRATFDIAPALRNFLAPERRENALTIECARAATLKQAVESLGVPHNTVYDQRLANAVIVERARAERRVALACASAQAIAAQVPERIQARYTTFMWCPQCGRVYWEGSHWDRMRSVLAATLEVPLDAVRSPE